MDWVAWHEGYDDPGSGLSARRTGVGAAVLRDTGGAVLPEGPLFRFGSR